MSVIVKGMEMPTSCDKCRFCVNGFTDDAPMYECAVQSEDIVSVLVESDGKPFDFRPDWCPLIELPPHGDLVDRNELLAEYDRQHEGEAGKARKIMEQAKAVIEAEGET